MRYAVDGVRRVPVSRPARPAVEMTQQVAQYRRPLPALDGLRRLQPAPAMASLPTATELIDQAIPSRWGLRPVWAAAALSVLTVSLLATAIVLRLPHANSLAASSPIATAARPSPAAAQTPIAAPVPAVNLQQIVNQFAAAQSTPFGIVVKDLKTGQTATSNADQVMISASLYKLFVAAVIYHRIDNAQLDYGSPSGIGSNISDCLHDMITWSDNDCGRALGSVIDWNAQNDYLHSLGFIHTDLSNPEQHTSASDVAALLDKLYSGTLLSPNATANFLGLLKAQQVNDRFPTGLPAGTVIAHKTGDLDGFVHDAGVVYGPKTDFLIVAASGPWTAPGTAPAQFGQLASKVWAALEQ